MKKQKKDILLTAKEILQNAEDKYGEYITKPLRNSKDNTLEILDESKKFLLELITNLKWALLFGEAEAAYYLAQFHYKGWLFKQSDIKGDFIILIGKKLGSQKCLGAEYKSDLSTEVVQLATTCASTISNTKLIYTSNTKITDAIKQNTEYAINRHFQLNNNIEIFDPYPISTVSAPLPIIHKEQKSTDTANQMAHTVSAPLPHDEETPLLAKNSDINDKCPFCLII